jgi:hypothetical protein
MRACITAFRGLGGSWYWERRELRPMGALTPAAAASPPLPTLDRNCSSPKATCTGGVRRADRKGWERVDAPKKGSRHVLKLKEGEQAGCGSAD